MSKKNTKKVISIILASMAGISVTSVTGAIIGYDCVYPRYNRPDYSLVMGNYYYERVKDSLFREEFYFKPHDETLKGYFYPSSSPKGLVVVSNGFHSGADDYIPIAEFFVNNNYSVFMYDGTGIYDSKGEDMVGMYQSIIDLDAVLNYIKNDERFSSFPVFLVGHSWGGFTVTSTLALHSEVKGCFAIAPFNDGKQMVLNSAEKYAGKIVRLSSPILNAYQSILFGDKIKMTGVKGINSTTCPVIIAHGIEDESVSFTKMSITCKKKEITNPNVIFYDGINEHADHNNIWHSSACISYKNEIKKTLLLKEIEKGSPLSDDEKREFIKTVNHSLYSEINYELFNQVLTVFNNTL